MNKLNRAAVFYIVAVLFTASIAALTPVAIVVAQNNTTGYLIPQQQQEQELGIPHKRKDLLRSFLQTSTEN